MNMKQEIQVLNEKTDILSYCRDVASTSDQEKAFIVCDIGKLVQRYREWTTAMPRIKVFYAVKCNDDKIVLKTLNALGAGFDCSSKHEIDRVLEQGVNTDRIIFSHTTKLISYIQHAQNLGVSLMTFDNEQELYKIKKYYPDSQLVLRFRCDDQTAMVNLGLKFGCDHKTEAPDLLRVAQELNLNVVGVSFHVGSCAGNPQIYNTAIRYAREVFDLAKNYGYNFNLLNIGGGYPGESSDSIDVFAKIINSAVDEYFSDPNVNIIGEPGSFIAGICGTLATNIHSLRTIKQIDETGNVSLHNMYYINDGYYGSFNQYVAHNFSFNVELLHKPKDAALINSTIWGPTCDSIDKIWEMRLPQLNVGDWLIFHDMGDYTVKAPSEFNGFPRPEIYYVAKESIWMLLKDTLPFTENDFIPVRSIEE